MGISGSGDLKMISCGEGAIVGGGGGVYLCRYSEKTKKSEIFAILTDEMQLKECSFFKILGDDIVIAFEDKGNLEKNPSLCVFNKKILDI